MARKEGLIGRKVGMTQVFGDDGSHLPVTVIQAGPCTITAVRTKATDGYDAVQLGFVDVKPHRATMPAIGHAAKANTGAKRFQREIRLHGPATVQQGDVLTVAQFGEGACEYVDVSGVSKGKGAQGVMRRHGFGGMCASHGTERKHRSAGGIGAPVDGYGVAIEFSRAYKVIADIPFELIEAVAQRCDDALSLVG